MNKKNHTTKKLLVLFLSITALVGCSEKKAPVTEKENASNEPIFINYDRNTYENGCIYTTTDDTNYYIDYETLEAAPLCALPNCDHTSSSCVSKAVGSCPLLYNDYVYYFTSECGIKEGSDGREFYINSKLMRVKLESSEAETVAEFHDAVPDTHDSFAVADNVLYFQADDMNPKEDEFGMITYSNAGGKHFLCAIDLSTGKYTNYGSIYDGDKEYKAASSSSSAYILGILNNKLILSYSYLKEEIPDEKFEEEGFLMADQFTEGLFEFDLSEKTIKSCGMSITFISGSDTYGYYDKNKNTSVIYKNGEEITLDGVRVNNYSFVHNNTLWIYPDEPTWYDLSDKSAHDVTGISEVIDSFNGKLIVKTRGMNFKPITEEEL